MKTIILLAFIGITIAAPPSRDLDPPNVRIFRSNDYIKPVAQILRSNTDLSPDGSFTYSFETDDGFVREETGTVVNAGQENAFVAVIGSYRYFDPEGQMVEVHYTSDDRGFVPQGTRIHDSITNNAKGLSQ